MYKNGRGSHSFRTLHKKKTNANSSKAHRVHTSRSYIIRKVLEDTEE